MATNTASVEYTVLQRCYSDLVGAFKDSLPELCDSLFSKNVITCELKDEIRDGTHLPADKARKLVDSILNQAVYQPDILNLLFQSLHEMPWMAHVVDKLGRTFKEEVATSRRRNLVRFVCPCTMCTINEYFSAAGCPKSPGIDRGETDFPYLDTTQLSPGDCERLECKLQGEAKRIACKFADLTYAVVVSLESQPTVSIRHIVLYILTHSGFMLADVASRQKVSALREELNEAKCITDIFITLNLHSCLSFCNYDIIERVVRTFGTTDDQAILTEYVSAFSEYCKRSVFEVPRRLFGCSTAGPDDKVFAVKYAREATLENTIRLRKHIAEILHLEVPVLRLAAIDKGCVRLTFHIFKEIALKHFPVSAKQKDSLRAIGVIVCEDPGHAYEEIILQPAPSRSKSPEYSVFERDEPTVQKLHHLNRCKSEPNVYVLRIEPPLSKKLSLSALSKSQIIIDDSEREHHWDHPTRQVKQEDKDLTLSHSLSEPSISKRDVTPSTSPAVKRIMRLPRSTLPAMPCGSDITYTVKYLGTICLFTSYDSKAVSEVLQGQSSEGETTECSMRVSFRGVQVTDRRKKLFIRRNYPRGQVEGICLHPSRPKLFAFATKYTGDMHKTRVHVFESTQEPRDLIADRFKCLLEIEPHIDP